MHMNLLPQRLQLKIQWRGVMRRWKWIWILAAASATFYFGIQIQDLSQIQNQLATLDRQCEPLREMQSSMNSEQEQLSVLRGEKRSLEQIHADDHLREILGILTRASQPVAGRMQLARMSLIAAQVPVAMPAAPAPPPPPGVTATSVRPTTALSLQGTAEDDLVLSAFVNGLRSANVFDQVDLKSSTQNHAASGAGRTFQLDCRFEN